MATVKRDFHHPYQPYDIQYGFMNALYDCIIDGQGKSLSLLCGALTWLRDHQQGALDDQTEQGDDDGEPTWILEHAKSQRRDAAVQRRMNLEVRLRKLRDKELRQKKQYEEGEPNAKKLKANEARAPADLDDEARFELDEYESDDGNNQVKSVPGVIKDDGLSAKTLQLMDKLGMRAEKSTVQEDSQAIDEVKIFYCSRTHSQLTQFVNELRRLKIPLLSSANGEDVSSTREEVLQQEIKHLSLGSRKNLCINPRVSKLGSAAAINESCLELQQPGTPQDHKCPYIPNRENEALVNEFRDHTLAKIRDIEDLGVLGKTIGICPYYATRATIKPSEIVTLPYPLLLQKSAREALEISLKGHVVIIDEAHNLMDAISNIYSVTISHSQLKRSRSQLGIYLQKFRNKFKGKNRVYVTQVVRLLDSLSGYLEGKASSAGLPGGAADVSDLLAGKGADQINLYKLMRYLQESKLVRKVDGYIIHSELKGKTSNSEISATTTPVLNHVQSFLQALTNPTSEGCFFYDRTDPNDSLLKYMLLDPTHHFKEIVEDARAVILAGGTMSPMDDYVRHLFAYVEFSRLKTWSCGHIIPKENLTVWPVAKGPGGIDFDFTYEKRNSPAMIDGLGSALIEISNVIPDGLVAFFSSYSFLDHVISRWQIRAPGMAQGIWDRLSKQKPIFRESKESVGVEDILREYSKSIDNGKGGLLLSVIGGKMSEGINFSDRLGRGVVVVGLPFPNIQSAEWRAKLEYIEQSTLARGESRNDSKAAARDFYENACMRAVNQSIGRAIRHQSDFASIILLDRRYNTQRVSSKLPGWIKEGLVKDTGEKPFMEVTRNLRAFFKSKGRG